MRHRWWLAGLVGGCMLSVGPGTARAQQADQLRETRLSEETPTRPDPLRDRGTGCEDVDRGDLLAAVLSCSPPPSPEPDAMSDLRDQIRAAEASDPANLRALVLLHARLARMLEADGQPAAAEAELEHALGVALRKHPDERQSEMALRILSKRGTMAASRQRLAQAEAFLRRAARIAETLKHPRLPNVLTELADVLREQGSWTEAETCYRRALEQLERQPAARLATRARVLTGLGTILEERGDYADAEALYQRVLNETDADPDPAAQASRAPALNNLALLMHSRGDYPTAQQYYEQALELKQDLLGPTHPAAAISLSNLALLYKDEGRPDQAEPLYRRALALLEAAYGPDHPDVAAVSNNLAEALWPIGRFDEAEAAYRRAIAVKERVYGSEHPLVAHSCDGLAEMARVRGDLALSAEMYQRASSVFAKVYGPGHPDTAHTGAGYSALYWVQGNVPDALAQLVLAEDAEDTRLFRVLQTGSERQKSAYLATLAAATDQVLSFHLQGAPDDAGARALALRTLLRRKGVVAEAHATTTQALAARAAPADRTRLAQLAHARAELARAFLRGPDAAETPSGHRARLAELERRVDGLERELATRYAALRIQRIPVDVASVSAALPPGAALVEYAVYRPFYPQAQPAYRFSTPRYAAYVLRGDAAPRHVELGPAAAIDEAVMAYRDALASRRPFSDAARALDRLVFAPLADALGDCRDLYVAPDGALSLIPFAPLVDEAGALRIEQFRFNLLTSGRDLRRPTEPRRPGSPPLLIGGPDYGARAAAPGAEASRSTGTALANLAGVTFPPLGGALAETQALEHLIPDATSLTGAAAREAAVKRRRGPRILHVATHGFFLDVPTPLAAGARGLELSSAPTSEVAAVAPPPVNPMLRSGLAFAGANHPGQGGEDGILTALEASDLDLWGTQLVVLSACETGLGTITNGDGVYGLRRALAVSGAETQVMSLWKVDDAATQGLMLDYYRRVLAGAGRVDALRDAQLDLASHPETRHPYFWAAFIAAGDARTLEYAAPPPVRAAKVGEARPLSPPAAHLAPRHPPPGCGCRVDGPSRHWGAALLLALAGLVRRSARARRSERWRPAAARPRT